MKRPITTRSENGQAMAEFAVVLPVLALLLFAILQFGIAFNNYLTLTDAVRAGARAGAVSRHHSNPISIVENRVRAAAVNLDAAQLKVTVLPSSTPWPAGKDLTVTATYPYDINLLGLVVKSGRLTSTTVERIE